MAPEAWRRKQLEQMVHGTGSTGSNWEQHVTLAALVNGTYSCTPITAKWQPVWCMAPEVDFGGILVNSTT